MQEINPAGFGVVGDGVTDNATALISMRDYMLQNPEKEWTVIFSTGDYLYSNNRWLRDIPRVTVYGNSSTFTCTANKPFGIDQRPLYISSPFLDYADGDFPGDAAAFFVGYQIDDATIKENTITLSNPADITNFQENDIVLLHGFVQQFSGYPPNLRIFQYSRVTSVNVGPASLDLADALKDSYFNNWYELVESLFSVGKPRVIPLRRAQSTVPQKLHLNDMRFLPNTNPGSEDTLNVSGVDVRLRNVSSVNCTPSQCKFFLADKCFIDGSMEIDKELESVVLKDTTVTGEVAAATGARNLTVDGCIVDGIIRCAPIDNLIVRKTGIVDTEDVSFGAILHYFNFTSTRFVDVRNVTSSGTGTFIDGSPPYSLTVDAIGTSSQIRINDDTSGRNHISRLNVGTPIYSDAGTTSLLGYVTNVFFETPFHVVELDFTVSVTDVLHYRLWNEILLDANFHNGQPLAGN